MTVYAEIEHYDYSELASKKLDSVLEMVEDYKQRIVNFQPIIEKMYKLPHTVDFEYHNNKRGTMYETVHKKHREQYKDYYEYISSINPKNPPNVYFVEQLHRFLSGCSNVVDIGCGAGEALACLQVINPNARYTGIEVNETYINEGKRLYGSIIDFLNIDAFAYNDFSEFDRVYTYIPISGTPLLKKLYEHVWKQLKVGSCWYECRYRVLTNFLNYKHKAKEN